MAKHLKIYATLEVEHDGDFDIEDQIVWMDFPVGPRDQMIEALKGAMPLLYERLHFDAQQAFVKAKKKEQEQKPKGSA